MDFKNKTVVVTGSSRGIGRATAIAFGQAGANVVVNYIKDKEAADAVAVEVKKSGGNAIVVQADVADEESVKRMIDETVKQFSGIDILVNNAGIVYDVP